MECVNIVVLSSQMHRKVPSWLLQVRAASDNHLYTPWLAMRKDGLPARGSTLVSGTKGTVQRRRTSRDTASYVRGLFTRAAYLQQAPVSTRPTGKQPCCDANEELCSNAAASHSVC